VNEEWIKERIDKIEGKVSGGLLLVGYGPAFDASGRQVSRITEKKTLIRSIISILTTPIPHQPFFNKV
jgi:hypothetical protein